MASPIAGQVSEVTMPVRVGTVLDRHNRDSAEIAVDAADHPVVAAPGAMQSGKAELERLADAARGLGKLSAVAAPSRLPPS